MKGTGGGRGTKRDRQRLSDRQRDRQRLSDRQRDRQRLSDRQRDRQRLSDRETDRDCQTDRETDRRNERLKLYEEVDDVTATTLSNNEIVIIITF